jgi:peptide/nickel transport system substrate-binding protein
VDNPLLPPAKQGAGVFISDRGRNSQNRKTGTRQPTAQAAPQTQEKVRFIMIKNKHVFLIAVTVFLAISACSGFNRDKNALRYGFTTEPETLDPLNPANTADGRSILFNVFEGLVKPNTDGTFMPCIAESWTIEQNGLRYIFTLRKGLSFHDGSAVTPADVKFSLDTAAEAGFNGLSNIKETELQEDNTIAITLNTKDPDFLPYLTIGIVKAGNADREKNIFGTGPFYVESYTPQKDLVLKKFDNYWNPQLPHLDKVTFVFFSNYDALMVALRGGGIDGAFVTGSMAAQLDLKRFDIIHNRSAGVHLLALNNADPALADIRVRQALNYGIDVQGIIDAAFFGQGVPSGSPIIPGLTEYYEDALSYPYDPDKAISLLSQAGYDEDNKLKLIITVPVNYAMHVDTAQVIISQLKKIGVNPIIRLIDWPTWFADVYVGRNYQATVISLDSPVVSPRGFLARYHSESGENFINFNSAAFDKVYDAAITETDKEKSIQLYKDAQHVIAENAASVYLQDILYFIVLPGGNYEGALDYPLYVIDFASIYRKSRN